MGVATLFDEDNKWVSAKNQEHMDTSFETYCSEFDRIKEIVDYDLFALTNYPVVIDDGEFMLHASSDKGKTTIEGPLKAENDEGPDLNNEYSRGFSELFDAISGKIRVETQQDNPLVVVRESNDKAIELRYILLPSA